MNDKQIDCIEGLRTIGWVGIFLGHFRHAFFPDATIWLDSTPVRFIYSGDPYVRLFFVISGFVISYKYFFKEQYDNVLCDICKRYFRLVPPILIVELFVFIMMSIGAFRNGEASVITGSQDFLGTFNQFVPDIGQCLKEALFTTYLNGANAYIWPLWTMVYEYLGVIFIISAHSILKKSNWRWIFYGVFLTYNSNYYNYFVIGMLICDLYVNFDVSKVIKKGNLSIVAIVIGYLMLSMIDINDSDKFTRVMFGLGIMVFMLGILSSESFGKILGNKLMIKGGKIAYSAYIVHWPIIETVSCGLLLLFYETINYKLLVSVIFVVTFLIVIIFAYLLNRFIEPLGIYISRKMIDKN